MELQPDFEELPALFNANDVEYLIVGGYALAYHGAPRDTGVLDLLVRPEADNADRVVAALAQFGFGTLDLSASDFVVPDLDVGFIGREAFIANMRAAGRQRDLADIEDLEGT